MHDVLFADAAKPASCNILKLKLKAYSIGHELLLFQQGNMLLSSKSDFDKLEGNLQRAAIIRAALVCSQNWRENHQPHRWLKLWRWANRNTDYALAIADFRNYRQSGSLYPPAPDEKSDLIANGEKEEGGRNLGAPFMARLFNFISALPDREIKNYGETAFDFPLGLGQFLYFSHLESEGVMKIENDNEAQIREEMAGHLSAIEKEAQCQPS